MPKLNPTSLVPLYKQMYHSIKDQIKNGTFKFGEKIPTEDVLQEQYGLSRVTVRNAINLLVDEGLLVKMPGKGTFVAMPIFVESKAGGSFTKSCLQNHVMPSTKLAYKKKAPASKDVAAGLAIQRGDTVHQICRVRHADGIPVICEIDYFRESDTYILDAPVDKQPMSEIILSARGIAVEKFTDTFEVCQVNKELAGLLDCPPSTHLLKVRQVVMSSDEQILYYNEQFILNSRYKYVVTYN